MIQRSDRETNATFFTNTISNDGNKQEKDQLLQKTQQKSLT